MSAGRNRAHFFDHEPLPLERCAREAPAELARIVHRALAKDRQQRYQTAKDLLVELKSLKLDLELADKLKQAGPAAAPGERQPAVADTTSTLQLLQPAPADDAHAKLEPVGGAMPLGSIPVNES